MAKIVIIDNEILFIHAIKSVIERRTDHKEPIVFSSGLQFLEELSTITFDLVLLDISMPDADGFSILTKLLSTQPDARVIMLSALFSREPIMKAFQLGALGFMSKGSEIDEITHGIESVLKGQSPYFSPAIPSSVKNDVQKSLATGEWPGTVFLTSREQEVLRLLSFGKTTKEIAEQLIISVRTAENHRRHIMEKLEVQNSTSLITKAIKLGLICI